MGRPRKNKVGEYAANLADELLFHVNKELAATMAASHEAYRAEVAVLRAEVVALRREVAELAKKQRPTKAVRSKIGKWVPGGPGRPPKDAEERVAAFTKKTRPRKKR